MTSYTITTTRLSQQNTSKAQPTNPSTAQSPATIKRPSYQDPTPAPSSSNSSVADRDSAMTSASRKPSRSRCEVAYLADEMKAGDGSGRALWVIVIISGLYAIDNTFFPLCALRNAWCILSARRELEMGFCSDGISQSCMVLILFIRREMRESSKAMMHNLRPKIGKLLTAVRWL